MTTKLMTLLKMFDQAWESHLRKHAEDDTPIASCGDLCRMMQPDSFTLGDGARAHLLFLVNDAVKAGLLKDEERDELDRVIGTTGDAVNGGWPSTTSAPNKAAVALLSFVLDQVVHGDGDDGPGDLSMQAEMFRRALDESDPSVSLNPDMPTEIGKAVRGVVAKVVEDAGLELPKPPDDDPAEWLRRGYL